MTKMENKRIYKKSIDRLRFVMLILACVYMYGLPGDFGRGVQIFCGFAPPASFFVSGFLILRKSRHRSQRILRTIKRSAIWFSVLSVIYFLLNLSIDTAATIEVVSGKGFWFHLFVMNVWELTVGAPIWYVLAFLYSYIIIYFLEKYKLLKFDWIIMIVCLVFTVITGELSGVFKFNFFGYTAIPGNFITRGLPYILAGSVVRRKLGVIASWKKSTIVLIGVAGFFFTIFEVYLLREFNFLNYAGHFIGLAVFGIAFCIIWLFTFKEGLPNARILLVYYRYDLNLAYYLSAIIFPFVYLLFTEEKIYSFYNLTGYSGIISIALALSLVPLFHATKKAYLLIKRKFKHRMA